MAVEIEKIAKLADLNLHDAEILSRVEEFQPGAAIGYLDFPLPICSWSAVAIVSVRMDDEILSLIYCLWDHISEHSAPDDWTFSKVREHWLYDEVDIIHDGRGPFVHRILFSTGVELEIPFTAVVIHRFPVHAEAKAAAKKQSA